MSVLRGVFPGARGWRQTGILAILALVFIGSGVLRIGAFGAAFAATEDADAEMADMESMSDHSTCPNMGAISAALEAIEGRDLELAEREQALSVRQSQLDAAEQLVMARLEELEAAEARLTSLLATTDEAAASDVEQLIAFYEAMNSEDAAELFAEMDPNFAAGFLSRMRPESGAGVLAELPADQAYAISVILATRNADVPRSTLAPQP